MSKPESLHKSKTLWFVIGIAFSIGLLWWVMRDMLGDPVAMARVKVAFREADYRTLPVIFAVLALFYWLKAWRWKFLLSPVGEYDTTRDLLPPVMIGFGVNNLLPAHLGELVRCFVFSKQQKLPLAVSLSSVVLERVFDVIAILFYLCLGLFFIEGVDPKVKDGAYLFAAGAGAAVLGGMVYVIWTKPFLDLFEGILKRVPFLPHSFVAKICGLLEAGAKGLATLRDGRILATMLVISLVKWALNGSLVLLSLWSFGIVVPATVAMVVLGVVAIGVTIPSSPGYFGVIQFCFMVVLKLFVSDEETIFAASIYYHLSQWVPVTLAGLLCLWRAGLSLSKVEHVGEEIEEHLDELPGEPHIDTEITPAN